MKLNMDSFEYNRFLQTDKITPKSVSTYGVYILACLLLLYICLYHSFILSIDVPLNYVNKTEGDKFKGKF